MLKLFHQPVADSNLIKAPKAGRNKVLYLRAA